MVLEGALVVGSISIITLAVSRFKCFIKKNGHLNYGLGCTDKPLIDDTDELIVKQFDLGENVKGIYVVPRHIVKNKNESESESESESD
jgi:uncharacterized membrane protein